MGPGELIDPIQGRPWKELICDSSSDGNFLWHVGAFSMHQKLEVAQGSICSFGLGIVWACLKVPFSSTILASEHVSMELLEYLHRQWMFFSGLFSKFPAKCFCREVWQHALGQVYFC